MIVGVDIEQYGNAENNTRQRDFSHMFPCFQLFLDPVCMYVCHFDSSIESMP